MVETGHHIWHEILDALGPIVGILFVAGAVLIGLWIWKRNGRRD